MTCSDPKPPLDVPARNPRVSARVLDGRALLVVIDRRRLHRLNRTATRIWELCDGRSLDEIAQVLVAEFGVERETARNDVEGFVRELREQGALMPVGAAS